MEDALGEAARWHARLQAPDCSDRDIARFNDWVTSDPAHRHAYDRVATVSAGLAARARTDQRLQAMADQAHAQGGDRGRRVPLSGGRHAARDNTRRRRRWALPAVAAVVAAAALGWFATPQSRLAPEPLLFTAEREQRRLALDDGSVVHLDVASSLSVRMTPRGRSLELTRGRAIFDVAHDPGRAFTVTAGSAEVTALGTRFEVQLRERELVITLAQGAVEVLGRAAGGRESRERLAPGEQVRLASRGAGWHRQNVDVDAATSWARGRHAFRDVPLADALEDVNRYATPKVRLGDAALADLRVSGNFVAGDSRAVAEAFAAMLPLRVIDGGDELVLFQNYRADPRHDGER